MMYSVLHDELPFAAKRAFCGYVCQQRVACGASSRAKSQIKRERDRA
jgi:hypothetical protein